MDGVRVLDSLFSFSGRTVAITGGAGALPGELARNLAALGLQVALLDKDEDGAKLAAERICSDGGTARGFACDVLDPESVRDAHRAVRESLGPVDYLINGAGGNVAAGSTRVSSVEREDLRNIGAKDRSDTSGGPRTFFDIAVEDFRFVADLNFLGTVIPTREFARTMAEAGSGAVLNFASAGTITPLTKVGAYSAAKAAVGNVTKWLAVHLAPSGVRVNALVPGFIMTEQLRFLHVDQNTGEYTPRAKEVLAHTPMGRYGEPRDLVGATVWLLSEAASFVTGSLVVIDGGFTSYAI